MKLTARKIIELSLIECGAISPGEDVDFSEVDHGLSTLNRVIGRYNADSLFAYTKYRHLVDLSAGKSEFTIGIGDGKVISTIESVDADNIKITYSKPHGYNTDDTINIYDTENFNGTGYDVTAVTNLTATVTRSPALVSPTETSGITYDSLSEIPDIKKVRPNDVESIRLIENGTYFQIEKIWQDTWDQNTYVDETDSNYLPHYYSYFTDYPFGKIVFEASLDRDYTMEIIYPFSMDDLVLDTEVYMPSGYVDALVLILADQMCSSYGIDNPKIKMEASNAIQAIRKANITPSTVKKRRSSFNFFSGRHE